MFASFLAYHRTPGTGIHGHLPASWQSRNEQVQVPPGHGRPLTPSSAGAQVAFLGLLTTYPEMLRDEGLGGCFSGLHNNLLSVRRCSIRSRSPTWKLLTIHRQCRRHTTLKSTCTHMLPSSLPAHQYLWRNLLISFIFCRPVGKTHSSKKLIFTGFALCRVPQPWHRGGAP